MKTNCSPPLPNERLAYSVPALCKHSDLGRSLIYEHIRQGLLRTTKVGSRTIILRADAERWLASLQKG